MALVSCFVYLFFEFRMLVLFLQKNHWVWCGRPFRRHMLSTPQQLQVLESSAAVQTGWRLSWLQKLSSRRGKFFRNRCVSTSKLLPYRCAGNGNHLDGGPSWQSSSGCLKLPERHCRDCRCQSLPLPKQQRLCQVWSLTRHLNCCFALPFMYIGALRTQAFKASGQTGKGKDPMVAQAAAVISQ